MPDEKPVTSYLSILQNICSNDSGEPNFYYGYTIMQSGSTYGISMASVESGDSFAIKCKFQCFSSDTKCKNSGVYTIGFKKLNDSRNKKQFPDTNWVNPPLNEAHLDAMKKNAIDKFNPKKWDEFVKFIFSCRYGAAVSYPGKKPTSKRLEGTVARVGIYYISENAKRTSPSKSAEGIIDTEKAKKEDRNSASTPESPNIIIAGRCANIDLTVSGWTNVKSLTDGDIQVAKHTDLFIEIAKFGSEMIEKAIAPSSVAYEFGDNRVYGEGEGPDAVEDLHVQRNLYGEPVPNNVYGRV